MLKHNFKVVRSNSCVLVTTTSGEVGCCSHEGMSGVPGSHRMGSKQTVCPSVCFPDWLYAFPDLSVYTFSSSAEVGLFFNYKQLRAAGGSAHRLRSLTALPEDPGLSPSIHMVTRRLQ